MDRLSISDRLESTTPVRNVGPHDSPNSDAQQRRRQRATPKPEGSDDPAESQDPEGSPQLDELA